MIPRWSDIAEWRYLVTGMTFVEALTNRLPAWNRTNKNDPKLPENVPQPFDDIAKHCLSGTPDADGPPPRSENAWTDRR